MDVLMASSTAEANRSAACEQFHQLSTQTAQQWTQQA